METSIIRVANCNHGKGVFAEKEIIKGEVVLVFNGQIISFEDTKDKYTNDHSVQIGMDRYIGPDGGVGDYVCHSCDPNSGLSGDRTLIALKNIKKGEEISFDYSTCMDEDYYEIDCKCGSPICRGRIRDFKYLSKEIQRQYIAMGIVPDWLRELTSNYK